MPREARLPKRRPRVQAPARAGADGGRDRAAGMEAAALRRQALHALSSRNLREGPKRQPLADKT